MPFRFRQRPVPYRLRSRRRCRMARPVAMVSTSRTGPRISKSIGSSYHDLSQDTLGDIFFAELLGLLQGMPAAYPGKCTRS